MLVNNAGFQHVAPVEEFPPERFAAMLALMVEAPFRLARAVLPGMYERGWGRVVNISSVHGLRASPYKSAYVAAKHGLEGLSKVIALEGGPRGVTSNCICPAYVRTPLVESQIADQARIHGISEDEVVEKVMLDRAGDQAPAGARRGRRRRACSSARTPPPSSTAPPWSSTAAGPPASRDVDPLQPAGDHQVPQPGLRLLKGEPDSAAGASEPGRRDRRPDPDRGRGKEPVHVVLGAKRGRRERPELEGRTDRIGMHPVEGPDPVKRKLRREIESRSRAVPPPAGHSADCHSAGRPCR